MRQRALRPQVIGAAIVKHEKRMADLRALDLELRRLVYDKLIGGGTVPSISALVSATKASDKNVRDALSRLSDAHMFVLQRNGEILMANPFSAVPTPFLVSIGQSSWYGNCIWDAMGVAVMLHGKARIETSCGCCGTAMTLLAPDDCTDDDERVVHFSLPAVRWWDDIVFN